MELRVVGVLAPGTVGRVPRGGQRTLELARGRPVLGQGRAALGAALGAVGERGGVPGVHVRRRVGGSAS